MATKQNRSTEPKRHGNSNSTTPWSCFCFYFGGVQFKRGTSLAQRIKPANKNMITFRDLDERWTLKQETLSGQIGSIRFGKVSLHLDHTQSTSLDPWQKHERLEIFSTPLCACNRLGFLQPSSGERNLVWWFPCHVKPDPPLVRMGKQAPSE